MLKITLVITGLYELLGRNYGIEEPYWGPSLKGKMRLCSTQSGLLPLTMRKYHGISIKLEIELKIKEKFLFSAPPYCFSEIQLVGKNIENKKF